MKKRKLKPFVKVSILTMFLIVCLLSVVFLTYDNTKDVSKINEDFTYL